MATKTKTKTKERTNSEEFEAALAARHPVPELYRPGRFTMRYRMGFPVTEVDHEANSHHLVETARQLGVTTNAPEDAEIVSDETEAPERSDDPDYVRLHSVRTVVYSVPVNEVVPVETRAAGEDDEAPALDPAQKG